MQTQNEILNSYIGKLGYLIVQESIKIPVRVIESKYSFGYISVLVKPLVGNGALWLRTKRLINNEWKEINGNKEKPRIEIEENNKQLVNDINISWECLKTYLNL